MGRAVLLVALLGWVGCGKKADSPEPELAPPPEANPDATVVAPTKAATPVPLREIPLAVSEIPFTRGKLKKRTLELPRGNYLLRGSLRLDGGVLLFLGVAKKRNARIERTFIYDPAKEKVVAKMAYTYAKSVGAKVVVGYAADAPESHALYDAQRGRVIQPAIRVPAGIKALDTAVIADDETAQVWVFAKGDDGQTYLGQWKDVSKPTVVVDKPVPIFAKSWIGRKGRIFVFGDRKAPNPDCPVLLLDGTEPARCLERHLQDSTDFSILEDGWVASDDGIDKLGGIDSVALPPKCRFDDRLTNTAPPRVLFGCERGSGVLFLWSPGSPLATVDLGKAPTHGWPGHRGHVLAESRLIGDDVFRDTSSRWIDFDKGQVFTTEPLVAASYGATLDRRFFALRQSGNSFSAIDLDLDAKTATEVAKLTCKKDIPREVVESRANIDVLACHKGSYGAPIVWAEIFDFERKKRWRATKLSIETILPDGTVLASNRSDESGEAPATFTTLYALELK